MMHKPLKIIIVISVNEIKNSNQILMSCKNFVRSFGFTILTLFTIGSTVALFALSTYYIYKVLDGVSDGFIAGVIVALCVSFLVFCFGIYASCKGTKCSRSILAIIYIIYALFIGFMAIFFLAFKNKIIELIGKEYNKNNNEFVESINKAFNCHSWEVINNTIDYLQENKTISCKEKICEFYNKTQLVIGIILIGVFLILIFGIVLVFKYICCSNEDDSSLKEQISTPLTYGW